MTATTPLITLWDMPRPVTREPAHIIHANSRAAWRTLNVPGRNREVLEKLDDIGAPATDRQLCYALGKQDLNYCRPSITRLIQEGLLVEVGDTECPITHRQVRRVWFTPESTT